MGTFLGRFDFMLYLPSTIIRTVTLKSHPLVSGFGLAGKIAHH
jgi:hypothetical protein